MLEIQRTPVRQKAIQLAKTLNQEKPDYNYIRELFRHLRKELGIEATHQPKKPLYIPTEEEVHKYYNAVWQSRNMHHVILIKTLLYTGVRVSELINIKIDDVDFDHCQIKIPHKKKKVRDVPFPTAFKETLAMHANAAEEKGKTYLFESSWKKPYTDRGIRRILAVYTKIAGMPYSISPNKLRHFLFAWLKKQGIDDALIQPYSGHKSMLSFDVYSRLSTGDAHAEYDSVIGKFPV